MLRFPNPGSDIDSVIRIFHELFAALKSRKSFGLDDITKVLIEKNLVTSSGFTGEEALKRSTRQNRSKDPLYNQSKAYAELYKLLGFIHPSKESKLNFNFTFLGAHLFEAKKHEGSLFKESILGIVYPTNVLDVKGEQVLRPFAAILRTMGSLDNKICRDELIIGPLCLQNDRNDKEFEEMIKKIKTCRGDSKALISELKKVSTSRDITLTTMGNYTRFPIAVLRWTGWVEIIRENVYGYHSPFLILTDKGKDALDFVSSAKDIRYVDIEKQSKEIRTAIAKSAFYQMLIRSGFDVPQDVSMQQDLPKDYEPEQLLCSPFQEFAPEFMNEVFPVIVGEDEKAKAIKFYETEEDKISIVSEVSTYIRKESENIETLDEIHNLFKKKLDAGHSLDETINIIFEECKVLNKGIFYPLVAKLFSSIGYECSYSRAGVNYQRSDAMIEDKSHSIPIEIKSPGEEEFISVKGIRQALENKIVLLSRKAYPTTPDTTSLVVGYQLPNNRSDVTSLVSDIKNAYGITIGVIDFKSLLKLVGYELFDNRGHNKEEFRTLYGIINVSNI